MQDLACTPGSGWRGAWINRIGGRSSGASAVRARCREPNVSKHRLVRTSVGCNLVGIFSIRYLAPVDSKRFQWRLRQLCGPGGIRILPSSLPILAPRPQRAPVLCLQWRSFLQGESGLSLALQKSRVQTSNVGATVPTSITDHESSHHVPYMHCSGRSARNFLFFLA